MSELLTIRGVKFRKKAFADMSFSDFKKRYEKQMPWKKIDPKLRDKALKDDFEKLTGNKPGKREKKTDAIGNGPGGIPDNIAAEQA